MDEFKLTNALAEVSILVKRTNKLIDDTFPWELAKNKDLSDVLESVMYHLLESIRLISIMYLPVLVTASEKVFDFLNVEKELRDFASCEFGKKTKYDVVKKPKHLFPRLDTEKEVERVKEMIQVQKDEESEIVESNEIGIVEFEKIELKVGKVLEAKAHKNADKLLVLKIDTGDKVRQIVSGIAKFYKPEELIGKKLQVVSNLKPVKLRGELSEGMILCGETSSKELFIVFVSDDLNPGDKIS